MRVHVQHRISQDNSRTDANSRPPGCLTRVLFFLPLVHKTHPGHSCTPALPNKHNVIESRARTPISPRGAFKSLEPGVIFRSVLSSASSAFFPPRDPQAAGPQAAHHTPFSSSTSTAGSGFFQGPTLPALPTLNCCPSGPIFLGRASNLSQPDQRRLPVGATWICSRCTSKRCTVRPWRRGRCEPDGLDWRSGSQELDRSSAVVHSRRYAQVSPPTDIMGVV